VRSSTRGANEGFLLLSNCPVVNPKATSFHYSNNQTCPANYDLGLSTTAITQHDLSYETFSLGSEYIIMATLASSQGILAISDALYCR
jgi:hypothetical protein